MSTLDGTQFDQAAERYDRARPGYPTDLFDDLVELTQLHPGSRVLEIGCGTGQATRPMAERGYQIVAVERGPALAQLARANLSGFANVTVHTARFEDFTLPDEPFDLVMAATSFHWLDQNVVYARVAEALDRQGWLAVFNSMHVRGGDQEVFDRAQACFERHVPGTAPGGSLPRAEDIPVRFDELRASGLFDDPVFRRYEWNREYTTDTYLEVHDTYSGIVDLDPENKRALFDCLRELIDGNGGVVTKRYLTQLSVARRAG